MKFVRSWCTLVGFILWPVVYAATPFMLPGEDRIVPSTLELERRSMPWCPGDCAVVVPFVASYRKGNERLVFVGAKHAFDPKDSTMQAVDAGFAEIAAKIVIIEGPPAAMGENPPPLVAEARRYGAPDANEYERGEAMYAASIGLKRGIPFLGGEPTRDQQTQVLTSKGFTDADIGFSALLQEASQKLRSGAISDLSAESLAEIYPQMADDLKAPRERGGWGLDAPTLAAFRQRYKAMYGMDLADDKDFVLRIDTGDASRHGQQLIIERMTRDRYLLGVIEQQLAEKHSVLVVYGASHWSTLSTSLEQRLGKPKIKVFNN